MSYVNEFLGKITDVIQRFGNAIFESLTDIVLMWSWKHTSRKHHGQAACYLESAKGKIVKIALHFVYICNTGQTSVCILIV